MSKEKPKSADTHVVFESDGTWALARWQHYDHGNYRWFSYETDNPLFNSEADETRIVDWVSLENLVKMYRN